MRWEMTHLRQERVVSKVQAKQKRADGQLWDAVHSIPSVSTAPPQNVLSSACQELTVDERINHRMTSPEIQRTYGGFAHRRPP